MKTYTGNIEITKKNESSWTKKLATVEHIEGYIRLDQGATLTAPVLAQSGDIRLYQGATLTAPVLAQIDGYVQIDTVLDIETERIIWKAAHKRQWYMTDRCSEWLLSRDGNIEYKINNVLFEKPLFDQIRKGELSASEVFSLTNMEQRRVAYERMDKIKMRDFLKKAKVLDEVKDDGYGYAMRLFSITMKGYDTPFYYLNCFCPPSGREYFLETRQVTCNAAKAVSFGNDKIVFDKEY